MLCGLWSRCLGELVVIVGGWECGVMGVWGYGSVG